MHQTDRIIGRGILILVTLMMIHGTASNARPDPQQRVRVTVPAANVREAPSPNARVVFQVRQGETFPLVQTAGEWLSIEGPEGKRGYILNRLVEVETIPPPLAPPPPTPETPPALPVPTVSIDHNDLSCALVDRYPRIDACLAPADAVGRAQVHFRAAETDPWYAVELKPEGSCLVAYLPKPTGALSSFEYYVFALDKGFGELERPEGAPAKSYRVKVVKKEKECASTIGRLARSVVSVVAPVVVSVARSAEGVLLDTSTAQKIEAGAVLAGFSATGVVIASTGAAPAVAAAGAAATGSGSAAGAGGISTKTLIIAGGAAAAGGTAIAVAVAGGSSEPTCSTQSIVDEANRSVASVPSAYAIHYYAADNDAVCTDLSGFNGVYRDCTMYCVRGVCSENCEAYFQRSDGNRFSYMTWSCPSGTLPSYQQMMDATERAMSFCGM